MYVFGIPLGFSFEKDLNHYTLAPSSYFRGQENNIFKAPEYDPENYEAYLKKQAEFEENVHNLVHKDVTLKWKEKYSDEQSVSGKFKEIYTNSYGRATLVLENAEGTTNIYLSEVTSIESRVALKSVSTDNIQAGFAENAVFEKIPASIPQEILKEALLSKMGEIAPSISPLTKDFQIQKISYIGQGTVKKVFRVEVMTDFGLKVFGLRLLQPVDLYLPSAKFIEGAIEEMDRFGELRELNGVAIDIKAFYSYDDFSNPLSMQLLCNNIYGLSIGEYVEGETIDNIRDENERLLAYKQAVKTVLRTWLLTVKDHGTGYTIGDLKGGNMIKVSEKLYESMSPVVFIDFGDVQNMDFTHLKIHILDFLRSDLGLVPGSQAEREFVVVMRDYIDEFLREKGDSLKTPSEKMLIINAANALMQDHPYLSVPHPITGVKSHDVLALAA